MATFSFQLQCCIAILIRKGCDWQALAVVAAGLEAASLLVPQGAYLAALDVLEELRAAVESGTVAGLHAFASLPLQLAAYAQVSGLVA